MCNLRLEVGGQIDDVDSIERTFLRTDAATDAEGLGNEGDARGGLAMRDWAISICLGLCRRKKESCSTWISRTLSLIRPYLVEA
jgi:hypothetical protein